jgi:hypothetical protein
VLALGAGTLVAIIAARLVSLKHAELLGLVDKQFSPLVFVTMPRGLAAVVLATLPASYGIQMPYLAQTSLLIVAATAVFTTAGVFSYERRTAGYPKLPAAASPDAFSSTEPALPASSRPPGKPSRQPKVVSVRKHGEA